MRSKKNGSMRKRKYGNKKSKRSNKTKKCGCGVKLPFLKWGGDGTNGPTNNNDLSGKFNDLLTNITDASKKVTSKLSDDFKNASNATTSVFNDTTNQITKNTTDVLNKTQNDAKNTTSKTSNFFMEIFFTNLYKSV